MKIAIVYRLAETLRSVVSRLPAGATYAAAEIAGDIMFYVWHRGRRNMIKAVANSLNLGVKDPIARNTARHCMRNFCKYTVDVFRYSYPKGDFFQKQIDVIGRENLDSALEEGKGIILVSFHTGNLDLGVRFLGNLGYPVNAVVENLNSEQLERFN